MLHFFSGKGAPIPAEVSAFVNDWLSDLPTVDSHYCRKVDTYKDKKFLHPGTTIANLHREYKQAAVIAGVRAVGIKFFSGRFHDGKYSVFIPRKDQCDVCVSFKHGNLNKTDYDAHIVYKDQARDDKAKDKESSNTTKSVWTMDLQAVLLCPKTKASSLYYKTKLQVHNFTLFDLNSKEGYCYIWNESEGDLRSEVFAYLQHRHFAKIIRENPDIKDIVVWSDGCGYQNRNANVANCFSQLSREHGIVITQKYLVAGHTQMECDSMHSTIERRMLTDIFTPRDYTLILQTARLRPSPYHVEVVTHEDMLKLNGTYLQSIRPGKKAGEPTVHDLRALQFTGDGKVYYKLSFTDNSEWKELPQRQQIPDVPFEWVRLFPDRLPIKQRKFDDLQSMKTVMPAECHNFFDTLPHK